MDTTDNIKITPDTSRQYNTSANDKKRRILYSWGNMDGSGKPSGRCDLFQLAMRLKCSMYEARLYAITAGVYDHSEIPIRITTHRWSEEENKPIKVDVDPPNSAYCFRVFMTYSRDESDELLHNEIKKLIMHKGRIDDIERILDYE